MEYRPYPPCPPMTGSSIKKYNEYSRDYSKFLQKSKKYYNYVYYWNRWFMKVYRWWSITILGRDPKPYFDQRY